MTEISVLLVDDHPVVLRGLREAIEGEPDLKVAAVAGTGREALRAVAEARPEVAILDVQLPDFDGIDLAEAILKLSPDTGIIILTVLASPAVLRRALAAGVHVFLLKSDPMEQIVEAVRSVSRGELVLSQSLVPLLLKEFGRPRPEGSGGVALTELEIQILRMVSEGASNELIASTHNYSLRSIKRITARICAKLRVENRTQAVAEALRRGLMK